MYVEKWLLFGVLFPLAGVGIVAWKIVLKDIFKK